MYTYLYFSCVFCALFFILWPPLLSPHVLIYLPHSVTLCPVANQPWHLEPNGRKSSRQRPRGSLDQPEIQQNIMLVTSGWFLRSSQIPVNISHKPHNDRSLTLIKHCLMLSQLSIVVLVYSLGEKHLLSHIQAERASGRLSSSWQGFISLTCSFVSERRQWRWL